ncbi:MAG: NAD(P)/FAD-dependent oxidoreductase [Crocinitomicaceae bacterium]|jgi:NADH dehydrogenase|nr:NAD(P)/FAD-dependent oxidoreductase [Crocinitomicaceae bacterium]
MLIEIPNTKKARVVIIGGGFGGIQLAKMFKNKDVQVVIVDKNNYHTFQPLMYQVATSALEAESIAYPIRKIFNKSKNIFFRLGEVTHIDAEKKMIEFGNDTLEYDYLVIASGAKTNYFGNEGLTISAMPMKSILESLDLRTMLLQNFEHALLINNERKKQGMMNVVIAGAGPTGVELAGALGELKRSVFPKDYPELDLGKMNIYLVQSGDRVLPMLSPKSSLKAKKYLEKLGVTVVLNTRVLDYFGDYVQTDTGQDIIAKTLIWTAGVTGNPIKGMPKETIGRGDRIQVDEFNQVKGLQDVFAIGDVACMVQKDWPNGHPQVAPGAMQQGKLLGKNLVGKICYNKPYKPFKYKDKGAMATVGKNKALVEMGRLKIGGAVAWFIWMVIHLLSLVGFRNKVVTMFNWVKNYFNSDRGMRLIITQFDLQEEKRKRRKEFEAKHTVK